MKTIHPVPEIPFYFIRHGETEGNVQNLCQGHIDFPLTEKGKEQARLAGRRLQGLGIKRVATSSLGRAKHSAHIIAEVLGLADVTEYISLIERGWGEIEGRDNSRMFAQEELEQTPSWDGVSAIKGIETKSDLLKRVMVSMAEVLAGVAPVLIIGHGRYFQALCEVLHTAPIRQLENGVPMFCAPSPLTGGWKISPVESKD